jgi:hypothetical protein
MSINFQRGGIVTFDLMLRRFRDAKLITCNNSECYIGNLRLALTGLETSPIVRERVPIVRRRSIFFHFGTDTDCVGKLRRFFDEIRKLFTFY